TCWCSGGRSGPSRKSTKPRSVGANTSRCPPRRVALDSGPRLGRSDTDTPTTEVRDGEASREEAGSEAEQVPPPESPPAVRRGTAAEEGVRAEADPGRLPQRHSVPHGGRCRGRDRI